MLTQEMFDSYLSLDQESKIYLLRMCEEMLQNPACEVPRPTIENWIKLINDHTSKGGKVLYMEDFRHK